MPRTPAKPVVKPVGESSTAYVLKLALYLFLGLVWVKWGDQAIFPVGFLLGLLFARHERFQMDRKIEYALLLVAALIGLFGPGIFLIVHF